MPSEQTDRLQDVQQRVELARKLFKEQGEFIRSILRYAVCGKGDTEDLYQELFLFFAARPIPSNILNIRGYLYTVVLDRVRDWHRSKTRYQTKIQQYGQKMLSEQAAWNQDLPQDQDICKILNLIEKHLSKTETRAILLRYRNQYSIEETAKEMTIRPRSVSRYISVGLKKIRKLVKHSEGDHLEGELK